MPACTKDDLIKAVAQAGFPKSVSEKLVETLIERLRITLVAGEDVLISGFGKFCVKKKRGRRGRNPVTGESIMLEPRTIVTFKWSSNLREKINW